MSNINYSIIIPHKNIPDLLQRCLNSIPVRDDVQVIVVDDNSDGDYVDFDNFPRWNGKHYEYYLTNEGKGAGFARNVGLEKAIGKWVLFVDADDFLFPAIDEIFDEEIETKEDVVFFRPKMVHNDNFEVASMRGGSKYSSYIDKYLETGDETELRTRWHTVWGRLIRNAFIRENNLKLEEIQYSNDVVFSALIGCEARSIVARDKTGCVITEREGSLTSNFCKKPGEVEMRASAFFRAQQIVFSRGFPIDERLAYQFLGLLLKGHRGLFKMYFNHMLSLMKYSRIYLINREFETNSPVSRFKRKMYAFFITLF